MILGIVILISALKNIWETVLIILHRVPKTLDLEKLESDILNIFNVVAVRDFHVWTVDNERRYAILHVVYENGYTDIKEQIRTILEKEKISHVTIELETMMEINDNKLEH